MLRTNKNSKKSNLQTVTAITNKIEDMDVHNTIPRHIINSKSKFTLKLSKQQPSSSLATFKNKTTFIKGNENKKTNSIRKSNIPVTSMTKTMPATKIVIKSNDSANKRKLNGKNSSSSPENSKILNELKEPREIAEIAIQTNEGEILNHSLIVGDLKIVSPSKSITNEIDKMRREIETKKLLLATRKFEEHSLQDERNLDNLKEFMDKNYITRRSYKFSDNLMEEDRKIIESMDELLQREKPKTESITDIKKRIKHKEQELLNLFDHFQKKTDVYVKTNT